MKHRITNTAWVGTALLLAWGAAADPGTAATHESVRVTAPPKELRAVGNQLQTPDGQSVWLQGVNVASLEWRAEGEHLLESIAVAIDEWNANVIRLPVNDAFWYGRNEKQANDPQAYRALVDQAIAEATKRGAYTILDLHRFKAPNADHVEFWKDAATRYKNNAAVLFGLFNEPHGISWDVWRDGGLVEKDRPANQGVIAENEEQIETFHSPGMQAMVDAVRETGARNIVVIGGLDWGYDLSGIVNGYALDDRGGNGIVYDSHVYPWKSDWAGKTLVAAEKYPVLIGEVGAELEPMSFVPPERHEDPYEWSPDMLGLIQKHKLHWTAWCFHPQASPCILADWEYTPTPYWGAFVRAALHGAQFGIARMR